MDESGALVAIYHKSHPAYINCFDTPHPYDVGMCTPMKEREGGGRERRKGGQ